MILAGPQKVEGDRLVYVKAVNRSVAKSHVKLHNFTSELFSSASCDLFAGLPDCELKWG